MVSLVVTYLPKVVLGVAGILGTIGAVKTLAAGGLGKRKRKRKKQVRRPVRRKAPKIRKRGRKR